MNDVQAIIFDWGGTLAQVSRQDVSYRPCAEAAAAYLADQGRAVPPHAVEALHDRLVAATARAETPGCVEEVNTPALLAEWADALAVPLPNGATAGALCEALWRPWIGCLDLLPGIDGTLRRLRGAGYMLGLVSNCAVHPVCCRAEVARQGLDSLLAFTLFSSELGVKKPHPEVYRIALERLSRAAMVRVDPGEVLFVGDTPLADHVGPRRCGMRTALVRTGSWRGRPADLEAPPDRILESVNDLPAHLTNHREGAVPPAWHP